jgi:hypothetical protein
VTSLVLLTAVLAAIWWYSSKHQPQRDAAAARVWEEFHRYATAQHLDVLFIHDVYRRAQTGSKAHVSIYNDHSGATRDAWFWRTQVRKGSVVAVRLDEGWGPHTQRDDVLFIGNSPHQPAVCAAIGRSTLRRARNYSPVH